MIDEKYRYFTAGGGITPGGPSVWRVLDWEQRRTIFVTMDEEQEDDTTAIRHLSRHIDTLEPNVRHVQFSLDGALLSTSTEIPPDMGDHTDTWYPSIKKASIPEGVESVLWSDLMELDTLGPAVDMVSYKDKTAVNGTDSKKAVFKYYFLDYRFMYHLWDEMNIVMRLPPHPNIMPLDKLVLDRPQGRIVGFTTRYIHGGTLDMDNSRIFKLRWLRQLTRVVDYLNLRCGIMHQDIAPRNLLVNSNTDDVVLFDFNLATRIDVSTAIKNQDDVRGVIFTLYEIITHDEDSRGTLYQERDPEIVQRLDEWVKHPDVLLDHPVTEFRSVLNDWVSQRRRGKQISKYTEAAEYIDWPNIVQNVSGLQPNRGGFQVDHADLDSDDDEPVTIDWRRPIHNKSIPHGPTCPATSRVHETSPKPPEAATRPECTPQLKKRMSTEQEPLYNNPASTSVDHMNLSIVTALAAITTLTLITWKLWQMRVR